MKVSINAGGREVEIECDGVNVTYADVADKALQVWRGTEGAKSSDGPAYGFVAPSQLHTNHSTYGRASFRHGDRPVVEGVDHG